MTDLARPDHRPLAELAGARREISLVRAATRAGKDAKPSVAARGHGQEGQSAQFMVVGMIRLLGRLLRQMFCFHPPATLERRLALVAPATGAPITLCHCAVCDARWLEYRK